LRSPFFPKPIPNRRQIAKRNHSHQLARFHDQEPTAPRTTHQSQGILRPGLRRKHQELAARVHDLPDSAIRPLFPWHSLHVFELDASQEPSILRNWEHAMVILEKILFD
jgi:hypothetical protein